MPGLTGLISRLSEQESRKILSKMTRIMIHEESYSYGLYSDNEINIGWTSHKNSFSDCLPIYNEKRDVILFISGEVFSEKTQLDSLYRKGHKFCDSNASYLVHLYEEESIGFLDQLDGHFCGILVDRRKSKTYLFNDRYGVQRIFIHKSRNGFYFATEAKALLRVLPETRKFDYLGICELLTCGSTLGQNSLYKDIRILPGGTLIKFNSCDLIKKIRYFDCSLWESQKRLNTVESFNQFSELFTAAAQRYAYSELPIGLSLTGGIDSRMIIAGSNPPPGSLSCYTFGSMFRDTYDVKVSRLVAKTCGQEHRTIVLGSEFLKLLPELMERAVFLSDGYIGLSGAAELYANSIASKIAPIRLTGNYGGEFLRGVRALKYLHSKQSYFTKELSEYLDDVREKYSRIASKHPISFIAFFLAPHHGFGRRAIETSQLDVRSPFMCNSMVRLYYRIASMNGIDLARTYLTRKRYTDLLKIPTDRGFLGRSTADLIYRRISRELSFKLEYLASHGAPDWYVKLERLAGLKIHESFVLGRHKYYHLRTLISNYLLQYIKSTYEEEINNISGLIDPNQAKNILFQHKRKNANYTNEIDKILTIMLINRKLLSGAGF